MASVGGEQVEAHPTIKAAEAFARTTLVVDTQNAPKPIDLGPVTHTSSSSFSLQGSTGVEEARSRGAKDSKYFLPHAQIEHSRLDLQHQIYLTTLNGKLNLAPISPGIKNALDIGTGTGIWAIDFARQHPSSKVLGFDLETHKPAYVPSNVYFQIHDAENPWPFTQIYDYIHGRSLAACFDSSPLVIQHAFKALAPGSYLEMQDCIMPMFSVDATYSGSATEKWQSLAIQGAANLGRDMTQVKNYKTYMEEAGFEDVIETHFQWPLGPWATERKLKAIGVLFREDMDRAIDGLSARLLIQGLAMREDEVATLLAEVRTEWKLGKVHTYLPIIVVYGRKPE